ncbi:hypothetical protein M011DRAFT_477140 [Sporormia fimetaria CBS 119925]|uniref:Uncharacterized protein n=1 Tax=Sporormia fimetaria CBS 119925 TaxID=1340428 RepID=A0A6A6VEA1_9PLEO|nr:hypothetical protein M011DRAFT_477140 [Sporormia fimetaria CBS 119925]
MSTSDSESPVSLSIPRHTPPPTDVFPAPRKHPNLDHIPFINDLMGEPYFNPSGPGPLRYRRPQSTVVSTHDEPTGDLESSTAEPSGVSGPIMEILEREKIEREEKEEMRRREREERERREREIQEMERKEDEALEVARREGERQFALMMGRQRWRGREGERVISELMMKRDREREMERKMREKREEEVQEREEEIQKKEKEIQRREKEIRQREAGAWVSVSILVLCIAFLVLHHEEKVAWLSGGFVVLSLFALGILYAA